jgi:RNA polymerase sigma factor (TIGR02999 family)
MNEITLILSAVGRGEPQAADRLLAMIYSELRALAGSKIAMERPGLTLNATGLVHEAYLRLFGHDANGDEKQQHWDNRGHFFFAAAEAMRRILIENARSKKRLKRGGGRRSVTLLDEDLAVEDSPEQLLELDEALTKLAQEDEAAAQLVKLRLFTGLSIDEVAEGVGCSRATAYRNWSYARAWLRCELTGESDSSKI